MRVSAAARRLWRGKLSLADCRRNCGAVREDDQAQLHVVTNQRGGGTPGGGRGDELHEHRRLSVSVDLRVRWRPHTCMRPSLHRCTGLTQRAQLA